MAIQVGDAILTFRADDNPLVQSFKNIQKIAQDTFSDAAAAVKRAVGPMGELEAAVKRAGQALSDTKANVEQHKKAHDDASATLQKMKSNLDAAKDAAKAAGDGMGGAGKTVQQLEGELKKAETALGKAERGLQTAKDKALAFSGGLRDLRQEVAQAEEKFRSAQTRVDSTAAALDKAKTSGKATTEELNKLQKELERDVAEAKKFSDQLDKKKEKLEAAEGGAKKYNDALKAARETVATSEAKVKELTAALESAKAGADKGGKSIADLERELRKQEQTTRDAANRLQQAENQMKQTEAAAEALTNEYKNQSTGLRGLNTQLGESERVIRQHYGELMDTARNVGMAFTAMGAAILGGFALGIKSAIDYETAFAGVRKTVEASEAEFARLKQDFIDLSNVMPTSAVEFAKIGELAGQLGIKSADIEKFAETIAMVTETTGMASEEAATLFARFANITGMDTSDFDRLGSALNSLENDGASTAQEIMNMALRIAAAGDAIGLTQPEILGFAVALSDMGLEAEMGGTAFSQLLLRLESAANFRLTAEEIADLNEQLRELTTAHNAKMDAFAERIGNLQERLANVHDRIERIKEDAAISAKEEQMRAQIERQKAAEHIERMRQEDAIRDRIDEARRSGNQRYAAQLAEQLETSKQQWEIARTNGTLMSQRMEAELERQRKELQLARSNEEIQKLEEEGKKIEEQITKQAELQSVVVEEFNKNSQEIVDTLNGNSPVLMRFAEVAGMAFDDFAAKLNDKPAEAIQAVIAGFKRVRESGGDFTATLGRLGMEGLRVVDALGRISKDTDGLARALGMSNAEWQKATSLAVEYAQRVKTTEAQMAIAKQRVENLGIAIGEKLLPAVNRFLDDAQRWVQAINDWIAKHPVVTEILMNFGLAIGGVMAVLGPLLLLLPGAVIAWGGLGTAITAATGVTVGFGMALGPMVAAGALFAIAAIAIGLTAKAWWDYREAAKGAEEANRQADESQQRAIETLKKHGAAIDELAFKQMDENQRTIYIAEQNLKLTAEKLRAQYEYVNQHTQLTDEEIFNLNRATDEQRKSVDEMVRNLVAQGKSTDHITKEVRGMLERFSLDKRESPSINDLAAQSFKNYLDLVARIQQPLGGLLDAIRGMWETTFNSIGNFVNNTINWIMGAANRAAGAVGNLFGIGGVPGFARGGNVSGPGALATIIAGEEGPEEAQLPDGSKRILGVTGPGVFTLPVGTWIKTARETAEGVAGDFIADMFGMDIEGVDRTIREGGNADNRRRLRALKSEAMKRLLAVPRKFLPKDDLGMVRRLIRGISYVGTEAERVFDGAGRMISITTPNEHLSIPAPNALRVADLDHGRITRQWMLTDIPGFARGGYVGPQGGGATIHVTNSFPNLTIREEADIRKISRAIAQEIELPFAGLA